MKRHLLSHSGITGSIDESELVDQININETEHSGDDGYKIPNQLDVNDYDEEFETNVNDSNVYGGNEEVKKQKENDFVLAISFFFHATR